MRFLEEGINSQTSVFDFPLVWDKDKLQNTSMSIPHLSLKERPCGVHTFETHAIKHPRGQKKQCNS
jgi:hypothetical protein